MSKQKEKIIAKLKSKKQVTNRELNSICFRYGARIWELRQAGYVILTEMVRPGLYRYELIREPKKIGKLGWSSLDSNN